MWNRLERVTAPATEAITLAEAKAQCRIDDSDSDTLIGRLIEVARDKIDGPYGAGIALVSQQWRMSLDCMPSRIFVPMGPVMSIDTLTYLDDGGTRQTLSAESYTWRKEFMGAWIKPVYNGTWPTVRRDYDSVQVTFTAGFPGTSDSPVSLENIPATLKHAMLLLVGHYYENREAFLAGDAVELPLGFNDILNGFRVGRF